MNRKFEFDEETLECPLCNELLSPPIHQCQNGHMGCKACCEKLKGKECPTCYAMPFAHSRCLGLELQLQCSVPTCCNEGSKRVVPEHFKNVHNAVISRCPQGIRSKNIRISWPSRSARYILFVVDKELFLVDIHYVAEVPFPVEQLDNQHAGLIMFCCSSFGNDSLKYNIQITVKSKEGVSSTCRLKNVLAFNNQTLESTSEDWDLILLPNVNPIPDDLELSLGLTLL